MSYLALMVVYRAPDGKVYEISGDIDTAGLTYQFFKALPEDVDESEFTAYLMDPDTLAILDMKNVSEGLLLQVVPGSTIEELIASGAEIEFYLGEEEDAVE